MEDVPAESASTLKSKVLSALGKIGRGYKDGWLFVVHAYTGGDNKGQFRTKCQEFGKDLLATGGASATAMERYEHFTNKIAEHKSEIESLTKQHEIPDDAGKAEIVKLAQAERQAISEIEEKRKQVALEAGQEMWETGVCPDGMSVIWGELAEIHDKIAASEAAVKSREEALRANKMGLAALGAGVGAVILAGLFVLWLGATSVLGLSSPDGVPRQVHAAIRADVKTNIRLYERMVLNCDYMELNNGRYTTPTESRGGQVREHHYTVEGTAYGKGNAFGTSNEATVNLRYRWDPATKSLEMYDIDLYDRGFKPTRWYR